MKRRNLFAILSCVCLVAVLGCSLGGLLCFSRLTPLASIPLSFSGPWTDPDYPTGTGWLLYPNGGENVSGVVTIRWNTSKTPELDPDDKIWIGWTHDVRGGASIYDLGSWPYFPDKFQHEDWEGCYCSIYEVITTSAPNTGEYQWNASEALEECNGEWYPFYLKIMGGVYMDASNTYFNITDSSPQPEKSITTPLAKVPAIADGFIAPGEWDDAWVVVLGYSDFYGYLYVKHNWTYLWVHLDCPSDTIKSPLGWDNGWVAIDPDMSGGSEPQEYDLLFHSHGHLAYIGDGVEPIEGSQWGILRGHVPEDTPPKYWSLRDVIIANFSGSGPGWGPTEASETLHVYWEFQIPLSLLELIPGLNTTTTFGFCASMQDHDTQTIIDWPVTQSTGNFWPGPDSPEGNYAPPDSWGMLTLGNASLDEKPPLPLPPSPPPSPPVDVFEVLWDDKTFHVSVDSNSNVSDFYFSQPEKEIGFNVTGSYGTTGFCNVTIPIELLDGAFTVRIDNLNTFYMLTRNETHTSLYFLYSRSTHTVQIIGTIAVPEFPSFFIMPLFMIVTLLAVIVYRRKHSTFHQINS